MSNTLRSLLATAAIGLSMPGAMAQSETFTGLTGNNYYVDYTTGLVMQLHGDEATVVSPQKVANEEFAPMAQKLQDLATEHENTRQAFSIDIDRYNEWLNLWQLQYDEYDLVTSSFRENCLVVMEQYSNLADILEKAYELQTAAKPAKTNGLAKVTSTTFTFDIWEIVSDLDYAEFMVNFTRDYLLDFEEDIKDFSEQLEESQVEIEDINDELNTIIEGHLAYIESVYQWLYEYAEYASEETLIEIGQDVQQNVYNLQAAFEDIPENPAEFVESWVKYCSDSLQSTYENYQETYDLLANLTDRITTLYFNFAGVLFAGPKGDEAGLYFTILNDNGSLILPPYIYCDEKDYYVTAIDGNIFSGFQEGFILDDVKLVLPATVTSIRDEAFAIDGIKEVTVYSNTIPSLESNSFTEETYANAILYVRENLVEDYRSTTPWNKFENILAEGQTAVNEIAGPRPEVCIEGSTLIVNTADGSPVRVYTADGKTLYTGSSNTIELPAKGLYIVRTANESIKIRY